MKKYFLALLVLGVFALGCSKNDDDGFSGPRDLDPQNFMWQAMNIWYFWQADVPNLANDRFSSDQEYTDFLGSESDPGDFFDNQLRFSEDRFSFYRDDYTELTQNLAGISRSNGLEFALTYFDDNNNDQLDPDENLFGLVRYIVIGSNAATADISRGEVFTGVDGQELTGANYRDLLFGDNATYTLNMSDLENGVFTPNGKEVTLTKEEGLVENPVFITKTFEVMGTKIGYLMYNSFTNEFDEDLNDAVGQLVNEGATELVLDLRYNLGGSVNSARLLSSMIYGTNTNDVFIRQQWSPKIQTIFDEEDLVDYFADRTSAGTPLNTLNLNTVYILATRSSASSSELVMNGLDPYIDVVHIGSTTRGKIEFSFTMVDDPDREGAPYIYSPSRENQINPNNSWAIQPLVGISTNSQGFASSTGLIPDIELFEDSENMGILGDINEPLLARAIQEITGMSGRRDFTVERPVNLLTSSKMNNPMRDNMVLDKEIHLNFNPR